MVVKGNKELLSVSISRALASEVREISKRRKRSVSSIVEEALARYLESHGLEREGEEIEEEKGEGGVPVERFTPVKRFKCLKCGYVFEAKEKPDKCGKCGSKKIKFLEEVYIRR